MKKERMPGLLERISEAYGSNKPEQGAVFFSRPSKKLVIAGYGVSVLAAGAVFFIYRAGSAPAVAWLAGFFKGVPAVFFENLLSGAGITVSLFFVLLAVAYHLKRSVSSFTLTSGELIIKKGLFFRKTVLIPLVKIRNVSFESSFLGVLFDYGTIHLDAGSGAGPLFLENVDHPGEKAKLLIENVKAGAGRE